jgi:hypothetical protein
MSMRFGAPAATWARPLAVPAIDPGLLHRVAEAAQRGGDFYWQMFVDVDSAKKVIAFPANVTGEIITATGTTIRAGHTGPDYTSIWELNRVTGKLIWDDHINGTNDPRAYIRGSYRAVHIYRCERVAAKF